MILKCLNCNSNFYVFPSQLKKSMVKYCSMKCYSQYMTKDKKTCLNCGTQFHCAPSKHQERKFCSKDCCSVYRTKPLEERFWKYVEKTLSCWIWKGARDGNQYGTIRIKKKTHRAHVLSWKFINGSIPDGMCVCHKCDTPYCVNPEHLFLGSRKDNTADMINKKRGGDMMVKLTPQDVYAIRYRHSIGQNYKLLAKEFNVHPQSIANIILKKSWKNLHNVSFLENISI